VTEKNGIPVTTPICTLIDIATGLDRDPVEAAINEADKLGLVNPEELRKALDDAPRRRGVGVLRKVLDRRTFVLTDSKLERYFLPIARAAGLSKPLTRRRVNRYRPDFHWPELGLVVEVDGLRYHRTPAAQAHDRRRDQTYVAAGLTPLRFTDAQVRFEANHVQATLEAVASRLRARS
jgi:very-short-patch-repair endonuclease